MLLFKFTNDAFSSAYDLQELGRAFPTAKFLDWAMSAKAGDEFVLSGDDEQYDALAAIEVAQRF